MMKHLLQTVVLSFAVASSSFADTLAGDATVSVNYRNNRYPLLQKTYIELPIGSIRPAGWMQEQLVRMKNGMTGNLSMLP